MEPATVGQSAKFLSALKDFPLWLLASVATAILLFRFVPTLWAGVPAEGRIWVTGAALLFTTVALFRFASSTFRWLAQRRRIARLRDHKRLSTIYGPLHALFLTRHVTAVTSARAPHVRDRMGNAREILFPKKSRSFSFRRPFWKRLITAIAALFDKKAHTSAEVEFGGGFPFDKIMSIVKANHSRADVELLNLVRWADRSHYEEPGRALMTDEEFELFEHITEEYYRLKRTSG